MHPYHQVSVQACRYNRSQYMPAYVCCSLVGPAAMVSLAVCPDLCLRRMYELRARCHGNGRYSSHRDAILRPRRGYQAGDSRWTVVARRGQCHIPQYQCCSCACRYDSHKDAILRSGQSHQAGGSGDFQPEQRPPDEEELFQYFSSSCFTGYNDGPKGFYTVYSGVFSRVSEQEQRAWRDNPDSKASQPEQPPAFGRPCLGVVSFCPQAQPGCYTAHGTVRSPCEPGVCDWSCSRQGVKVSSNPCICCSHL